MGKRSGPQGEGSAEALAVLIRRLWDRLRHARWDRQVEASLVRREK